MFTKRNLFAVTVFSASLCTIAFAQDAVPPKPPQIIERNVQIITDDSSRSYLGIKLQEVTKENFTGFGLKEIRGAAITEVSENSPAKQAGLMTGDVVVKFNGEEITSVRKLQRLVAETAPDRSAKITVFRGGGEKELNAVIGKRTVPQFQNAGMLEQMYGLPGIPEYPSASRMPRVIVPPGMTSAPEILVTPDTREGFRTLRSGALGTRRIGFALIPLNKQLGEYFGTTEGKGLLITSVIENSPAAKAGLKAGDVIIEADGKPAEARDLGINFGDKDKKSIVLTILRDKVRKTVTVQPEELKDAQRYFQIAPNS